MKVTAGICSTRARYLASRLGSCGSSTDPSNCSGGYTMRRARADLCLLKTPAKHLKNFSAMRSRVRFGDRRLQDDHPALERCCRRLFIHENETICTPGKTTSIQSRQQMQSNFNHYGQYCPMATRRLNCRQPPANWPPPAWFFIQRGLGEAS